MSAAPSNTQPPLSDSASVLQVEGLRAGYGQTEVLDGVSLAVDKGGVTALVGANGAGKSTLLKAVSGVIRPTGGTVNLGDREITGAPAHKLARLGICHIPEGRGIYRSLTVRDNLRMQSGEEDRGLTERAIEAFPFLGKRLSQPAGTLSGGEQQMLAMSAAFREDLKLVIVDEPSLGLAPLMVDQIFAFMESLSEKDIPLLVVDQYANRLLTFATRVVVLRRGCVVFTGEASSLSSEELISHYLGGNSTP